MRQVLGYLRVQLVDEFGLHELVVIGNVQSDDTFAFE